MATVEKRSKNHWRIGVRLPASQGRAWIRRTLVFPEGMSEAQQRARAILAGAQLTVDVAEGRVTPDDGPAPTRPQRVTVREVAEIWMREHVEPSCKPTTKKNYRHFLDCRILPALGDTMLDELTPIQLTGFINSVRADTVRTTAKPPELRKRKADRERPAPPPRQLSDRTVRHYYDCLDYMLGKAVQWKYLDVNPLERVDRLQFQDFIRAVACRVGQMLNVHSIAMDVGVSDKTAKHWLKILEASDIIFYLRPYTNNLLKRAVKQAKMYFFDTGLVAYLTAYLSPEILAKGALSGAILENYVVAEIRKTFYNAGRQGNFWYYRDRSGAEIDMVLEENGYLYPLEIKRMANPSASLVHAFAVMDKGALPRGNGAILCTRQQLTAIDAKNYVVPIWML